MPQVKNCKSWTEKIKDVQKYSVNCVFPRHFTFSEYYDVRANQWTKLSLQDPLGERCYVGTAVSGNMIFMAGGSNGTSHLQQVSRLDVSTGEFEVVSSMNHKRCFLAMAPIDENRLLAMGELLFVLNVIIFYSAHLECVKAMIIFFYFL